MMMRILHIAILTAAVVALAPAARACTDPVGVEGEMLYNNAHNVLQYCDGVNWVAMGAEGAFSINAVEFDGTSDHLFLGAPVGYANSNSFTASFWVKVPSGPSGYRQIFDIWSGSIENFHFGVDLDADQVTFYGDDSNLGAGSNADLTRDVWHHVLMSYNNGTSQIYLDDVLSVNWQFGSGPIPFAGGTPTVGVGSHADGTNKYIGSLAELWIDMGTHLDLSVTDNRRKFIDASGNPVFLGANGSLPTGSAPEVFMSGDTATWHTNKGTGGGFTENGALTTALTAPGQMGGCDTIGQVCADGTVYAGLSPDGNIPMYTTPCDAGMSWNGSTCTGSRSAIAYDDGVVVAGIDTALANNENDAGESSTEILVSEDSNTAGGFQPHNAATYCWNLEAHGADDWYLPAINEMWQLESNRIAIGHFESAGAWPAGFYWTTTEVDWDNAKSVRPFVGDSADTLKDSPLSVRCVRKGPNLSCANPAGSVGTILFNDTHKVMQYCNGTSWVPMGPRNYLPNAVNFNGSTRLTFGSVPGGLTDGKQFSGSLWFRVPNIASSNVFFYTQNGNVESYIGGGGDIIISGKNTSGTYILSLQTSVAGLDNGAWHHLLWSVDLSDPLRRHIYRRYKFPDCEYLSGPAD